MDKLFYFGTPLTDLEILKSMDKEAIQQAGVNLEELEKSISVDLEKAGLVQREITVQGKNGYYQKRVWVHPNESPRTGKKIDDKKASAEQSKKAKEALEKVRAKKKAEAEKAKKEKKKKKEVE